MILLRKKCLLYDCTNLSDFKYKLKVYEEIRRHMKNDYVKNKSNFANMKSKYQSVDRVVPKYENVDKSKSKYENYNKSKSKY